MREFIDIIEKAEKRRPVVDRYRLNVFKEEEFMTGEDFDTWDTCPPSRRRGIIRQLVEENPGTEIEFWKIYAAHSQEYYDNITAWDIPAEDEITAADIDHYTDAISRAVEQTLDSVEARTDRQAEHPAFRSAAAKQAMTELCGEVLGWGTDRKTYAHRHDPTLVVKVYRPIEPGDNDPSQNETEWRIWKYVENKPDFAKWFAPCVSISKDKHVLVQRRAKPAAKRDLAGAKVPKFMRKLDHHTANWGILGGRPVMVDYGFYYDAAAPDELFDDPELQELTPARFGEDGYIDIG